MKKNIKKIVYDIIRLDAWILSIIWDENQIFYQNDDEDENRAKAKFDSWKSFITFYRISEKSADFPKRTWLFQFTCWNKDNIIAENLKNELVEVFHRRQNQNTLSYVKLIEVWPEIYDKELKVYWIPLTFIFVYKDTSY